MVAWRGACAKPACALTRTTVSIQCGRAMESMTRTDKCLGVEVLARRQCDRKFIAGNATAHRFRRQRFLQPPGDCGDELVAAQYTVMCGDIVHAVELDQREGRAIVVGSFGKRQIEQFECLGVVRQPGKFVLVVRVPPALPSPPAPAARA